MTTTHRLMTESDSNGPALDYRSEFCRMADALRGSMDAAEYKHIVLGLILLKYISDTFEERHTEVLSELGEEAAEDRDEYLAESAERTPAKTETFPASARVRLWKRFAGTATSSPPAGTWVRHRRRTTASPSRRR